VETTFQNQLVQGRLRVASSLFPALRAKHPPSAAHGLRMALVRSSWTVVVDISPIICDLDISRKSTIRSGTRPRAASDRWSASRFGRGANATAASAVSMNAPTACWPV
jgi:hypothetical protein